MPTKASDQQNLQAISEKLEEGKLPQWALTDPAIHELEMEKIFAHTWNFLGHDSEIEKPGDYVTRWIVNDPIILVRGEDGEARAFLNSCAHRGTQLCTADFGNKKSFTCPYHGWTYNLDGDLIGVLAGKKLYGEEMDKSEWPLRKVPQIDSYQGMIFGSLDPEAMPLEEYLGDMKWYLDIMMGRTDAGMEVRGVPHRWIVNTNWKVGADNFGGDPYHTAMTHRSAVQLGIAPKDPLFASYGHQIVLDQGHGVNMMTPAPGLNVPQYQGLPKKLWPEIECNLSPEQLDAFSETTVIVGNCFPNLAFVSPMHGSGDDEPLTNFVNFRVYRPLGPAKIEIWSWLFVDKEAPQEFKEASYKSYVGSFGPSGTLEQDDTEIWTRIAQGNNGFMARDKNISYDNVLNYLMGMDRVEPDPNWVGPGVAYPICFLDAISRSFYGNWLDQLSKNN